MHSHDELNATHDLGNGFTYAPVARGNSYSGLISLHGEVVGQVFIGTKLDRSRGFFVTPAFPTVGRWFRMSNMSNTPLETMRQFAEFNA